MSRVIYKGPAEGLFNPRNFDRFMGDNAIRENNDSHHLVYDTVKPAAIVEYILNGDDAKVSVEVQNEDLKQKREESIEIEQLIMEESIKAKYKK